MKDYQLKNSASINQKPPKDMIRTGQAIEILEYLRGKKLTCKAISSHLRIIRSTVSARLSEMESEGQVKVVDFDEGHKVYTFVKYEADGNPVESIVTARKTVGKALRAVERLGFQTPSIYFDTDDSLDRSLAEVTNILLGIEKTLKKGKK